ncbi:MAG TPA: ABC transporter permease [Jiangellales bacterium]|nr:ABC transporter permease [Jiangellales bacterium]
MTTVVFVRRFLTDYARNPVNLVLLAVVPIVFVVVVARTMADAAFLLGGAGGPAVETATAGWAAAFLAGIGMYFQTAATREVDRRVVTAGLPPWRLVAARLLTGATLAAFASAVALVALAARVGVDAPLRVIAGTLMFAIIYVSIGAVVGSVVTSPVNGTVIVLFVWILDVFFGPAMGAADRLATRGLPTHYVTLWMVDLPSGHGGRPGDLGWALVWTVAALDGDRVCDHDRRGCGWGRYETLAAFGCSLTDCVLATTAAGVAREVCAASWSASGPEVHNGRWK